MPPGLGEAAEEEEVQPRGSLESRALRSHELDPIKGEAAWLFMRTEAKTERWEVSLCLGGEVVFRKAGEVGLES